jgi:hypothetical protein
MTTTVSDFKGLQSLEVCGGLITDAGVKNIKDLKALTLLNLSQNANLTDITLEIISGICYLHSVLCFYFTGNSDMMISQLCSGHRPDCSGLAEPVQLPGVQRWPPPSEAAAEPALAIPGVLQGYGVRDQEDSAGCPSQPDKRATRVIW